MATQNYTRTYNGGIGGDSQNQDIVTVMWTLPNGDTGQAFRVDKYADMSVQFGGTFGTGGTVVWEGSNDGTNYVTLTDPQGNAISKTAAAIESVTEPTLYVRPRCTAGDGTTAITVAMYSRRNA